jgi:hypothetical protein
MKSPVIQFVLLFVAIIQIDARLNEKEPRELVLDDDDDIFVFISFKNETRRGGIFSRFFSKIRSKFAASRVMSAVVKRSEFSLLQNDPDIDFIEEDVMVYPDSEVDLYGLKMVQATSQLFKPGSLSNLSATSSCSKSTSMKVGVSKKSIQSIYRQHLIIVRPNFYDR